MKLHSVNGGEAAPEKQANPRATAQHRRAGRNYWLGLGLLAWSALASATLSAAAPKREQDLQPQFVFTVQVYNYASVSVGSLKHAQREAARILQSAGVETVWLECPASGRGSLRAQGIGQAECGRNPTVGAVLRIMNRSGYKRATLSPEIFGYANGPLLIGVLYDRVAALADADDDMHEAAVILGDLMAHEIGHLLLGPGHSSTGIMRGQWDRVQVQRGLMGRLTFTPDQCTRIRAAIKARMKLPGASQASQSSR